MPCRSCRAFAVGASLCYVAWDNLSSQGRGQIQVQVNLFLMSSLYGCTILLIVYQRCTKDLRSSIVYNFTCIFTLVLILIGQIVS